MTRDEWIYRAGKDGWYDNESELKETLRFIEQAAAKEGITEWWTRCEHCRDALLDPRLEKHLHWWSAGSFKCQHLACEEASKEAEEVTP